MPFADSDGVKIYYEERGSGPVLLFAHEFADNLHGWKAQVDYFARWYRCIAFNARGYPPSTLPADKEDYGHEQSARDLAALLRHLKIPKAHMVGCSMGAYTILTVALMYPELVQSLTLVSGAAGSRPLDAPPPSGDAMLGLANRVRSLGVEGFAQQVGLSDNRIRLKEKQPQGHLDAITRCSAHSLEGAVQTAALYQGRRPSVFGLAEKLKALTIPVLLMVGDEDDFCIEPNVFLKRTIPNAGLLMFPKTGHAINLEEPEPFNDALDDFLYAIDTGKWRPRP